MGRPMVPKPMKPIFMRVSFACCTLSRFGRGLG